MSDERWAWTCRRCSKHGTTAFPRITCSRCALAEVSNRKISKRRVEIPGQMTLTFRADERTTTVIPRQSHGSHEQGAGAGLVSPAPTTNQQGSQTMPFKTPPPPQSDRLSDYLDRPVLLRPTEYKMVATSIGDQMVLWADCIIPQPDRGSGSYANLGTVPIFWKAVQIQLDESIGEWVGGRLHQGTATNAKAYVLQDPTADDVEILQAVVASLDAADF